MKTAGPAIHIAEVALVCWADTAPVLLLPAAIGIDIAVVIVIVGFADGHPLVQVLEVDFAFVGLVLIVVVFHFLL